MSTRGCVAVAQGDGWKGVYNHFDSYPTVLGKEVWRVVHEAKDFEAFVNKLLQFDDWRAYLKAGLCP